MTNPYIDYYVTQAGTGIAGFQGVRHQRRHGFFGRLMSKAVYPLLRFLGKRAVGVGADIASDVILDNKNLRESAEGRLKDEGKQLAKLGIERAKKFAQEGKGRKAIKRKRKTKHKNESKRRHITTIHSLMNG